MIHTVSGFILMNLRDEEVDTTCYKHKMGLKSKIKLFHYTFTTCVFPCLPFQSTFSLTFVINCTGLMSVTRHSEGWEGDVKREVRRSSNSSFKQRTASQMQTLNSLYPRPTKMSAPCVFTFKDCTAADWGLMGSGASQKENTGKDVRLGTSGDLSG